MKRILRYTMASCLILIIAWAGAVRLGWEALRLDLGGDTARTIRHAEAARDRHRKMLEATKKQNELFTRDYAKDGLLPGQGVQTNSRQLDAQTCSYTHPDCVIARNTIGAFSKADYDLADSLIRAQDFEALARLVLTGRAKKLEQGTAVTLMSESAFTGRAQVRPRGEVDGLWVARDVLGLR